jgi:hypothetical protein
MIEKGGIMRLKQTICVFILTFPIVLGLCQVWEPDQRLTYADSCAKIWGATQWPVATGLNNTVHIVWEDRRDGWPKEVYYKRSLNDGQTWESEIPLTANSTFFRNAPCIVADKQNRLHVAYTEEYYEGPVGYPIVHYKRSLNGGDTWGSEATIANLVGLAMHWSLATDLQDGVYIVYTNQTGGWYDKIDVFIKYSTDAGYTWQPATQLSTSMATVCGSVAADTSGRVHVVWMDNGTGNWQIMYRRSTDMGQSWGATQTLTTGSSSKGLPSISSDRADIIHVVWYDDRDGQDEVYYVRSTDGGQSWSTETRLTYTGVFYRGGPNITCDLSGNVYVVWTDTVGGQAAIGFNESTNGGNTWTQDTIITSADSINFYPGIIARDDGEYLHLVWHDKRTGYHEIYHKRRTPAGWLQEKTVLNQDNSTYLTITQNPARHNVLLKVIPCGRNISVKIFDLSGKTIVKLADCLSEPARLPWNCKDDRGYDVPSGVYIISAQGPGISLQKKCVIIR